MLKIIKIMKEFKKIQIRITLVAGSIATAHIIWPNLSIDAITLVLLIIAIIPWLAPVIKSFELPGGYKIELKELETAKDKVEKAGLLSKEDESPSIPQFSFQMVANEDPNLALAGLRIEIERRLNEIAESRKINADKKGIRQLLDVLSNQNVLTNEERGVLADLSGLLNRAVHGAEVDNRAAQWAIEVGPRILRALDEKLMK